MFETDYPYTASDGTCQWDAAKKETNWEVAVDSYFAQEWGPNDVMAILADRPVNISFRAGYPSFMSYSGGIFDDDDDNRQCTDDGRSDHTVPLIGYVREETLRPAATFNYYIDVVCRGGSYCI